MAGHHVGEQPYDQSEGLNEYAQEFHQHEDGFYKTRNARRVEDMTPVVAVAAEQDHHEGYEAQHHGKGDIAGYVGCAGDQTENIVDQDKEENGEQVRQVFIGLVAQVGFRYFVAYEGDNGLQ